MDDKAIWLTGALKVAPEPVQVPLLWLTRLDDPTTAALASRASLDAADFGDFAARPQSAMRAMRRKLTKVLLAALNDMHPQAVIIVRSATGAPRIIEPVGWYLSVAGQWPHCLIGVARWPLGVDIESRGAPPPPLDAFTERERIELSGCVGDTRLERWLMKEAHAKLFGVAAQTDANTIETFIGRAGAIARSVSGRSTISFHHSDAIMCAMAQGDEPACQSRA